MTGIIGDSQMDDTGSESGVSAAASGPAGSHFEGQVGAFYFLSMLAGAPPRGLPGTTITKVLLQQANAERPLDDVIIYAVDILGNPAVLEIQVKRSISFSPSDLIFKKVVGQIAKVMKNPDFWTTEYNLAIATSRGSWKIDGAYQDVLAIARKIGDAEAFTSQLNLRGVANEYMRSFVNTLKSHLEELGTESDDETIWKLLRKLHILTFDFTASGSTSEDLCRERALRVLHNDEASKVDAFWGNLIEYSIDVAKNAGDKDREAVINHFTRIGYKFSGDRRHFNTIATIAEMSSQALADIDNQVADVFLARNEQTSAVHAAFDTARYIEIRGDAGVGKSGVLKQIAETLQTQGNVLVLSPRRCVSGGWAALRAQLNFDGARARELLVELANGGGTVIFIDNLDMFEEPERLTVVDVLRAAVDVEGVYILATARTDFGVENPSWLPRDALKKMKCADPIIIGELSESEVEQLKVNAPRLAPLLIDQHPARGVTRNLYRLARIANKLESDQLPHTEAEMAYDWWKSGDGAPEPLKRDRSRLLMQLAKEALKGPVGQDVSNTCSSAIDGLVRSGTLTSLGPDRVVFRHDVLLEWSIGCLLFDDINLISNLDLSKPASPIYARGIELSARLFLEKKTDGKEWNALLTSMAGKHKTWRRSAILAVARSEAAKIVLPKLKPILIENNAALLRELIRTVTAVEVLPATKAFAELGLDVKFLKGLSIPNSSAWTTIILWLLTMDGGIPKVAVPEVTDFFVDFSMGTFGHTGYTELITHQLYYWLIQIRALKNRLPFDDKSSDWDVLDYTQLESLHEHLHRGFVAYARTTPELAKKYLTELCKLRSDDSLIINTLKQSGSLAQASPEELAKLTEHALIEKADPDRRHDYRERQEAFTYVDHEFIPSSPAQGPFYALLLQAPEVGLKLIHNLVSHVISHRSRNLDYGDNKISVHFRNGVRDFPWLNSYYWSRQCESYTIASALMALEAWAHKRIESDEPFEKVLEDVLGPPGSCAAYLLVAVDLLISHWPKSATSSIEFVGCPELLCIDRSRLKNDSFRELDVFKGLDLFGLGPLTAEPTGPVSAAQLNKRLSRKRSLDWIIGNITFSNTTKEINRVRDLLKSATLRTGPINSKSTDQAPEFMVVQALNMLDPSNWEDKILNSTDGKTFKFKQYVPTSVEQEIIQKRPTASVPQNADFEMELLISHAIEDSAPLTNEQLLAAVEWAKKNSIKHSISEASPDLSHDEEILATAMMIFRDGNDALKETHGDWARRLIVSTLEDLNENRFNQTNDSLKLNHSAMAYAGLLYMTPEVLVEAEVKYLLELTIKKFNIIAPGFGKVIKSNSDFDDRLQKSILRCAFQACIVPKRKWNGNNENDISREESLNARVSAAINEELKWLFESGSEPTWPAFPPSQPQRKKALRIPNTSPLVESPIEINPEPDEFYLYQQTAATWLRQLKYRITTNQNYWECNIVQSYLTWSLDATGGSLAVHEEADKAPHEWNEEFFHLAARSLVNKNSNEIITKIITPITSLPDIHFFDVGSVFLRSFDETYFDGNRIDTQLALDVRSAIAARLTESYGWQRLGGKSDFTIERHIARIIAVFFFNDYNPISRTKCYLFEKGIARLQPFLPVLLKLTTSGVSPFPVMVLLNLMEVSPKIEHLEFLAQSVRAWLSAYPDLRTFWVDQANGSRWCEIVKTIFEIDHHENSISPEVRDEILSVLSELIPLGIPEANQLEDIINSHH